MNNVEHATKLHNRCCLVILPTYNEASNIERLIAEILAQGSEFDILVVDDNSPDGTGDLVAAIARDTPRVRLLRRSGKLGLGSAYVTGFNEGLRQGYEYLCEMDADFSHQPHYLPVLLAQAKQEADVVLGSRYVNGGGVANWPWKRKLISKGGSLYARVILHLPIRDCTGGFKCFRASVLRHINLVTIQSNGYAFQIEVNYRCHRAGFHIHELPIVFLDRARGYSKMSLKIALEAAMIVWKIRYSQFPTGDRAQSETLAI